MLARLLVITLCTATIAAPVAAKEKGKIQAEVVTCAGAFGADSSERLLIDAFGAENVVTGQVPGPEGTTYLGTTVFGNDPERTMIFSWFDEEARTRLSAVDIGPSQIGPGGVRIGMTAAEVEAINGDPFTMGGFWWDYGGYAGFDSGALAGPLPGGCYLSLRFAPPDEISSAIDITPITGDVQVRSDEGLLDALGVSVEKISLGYALDPVE
jgi:hypothetical protein